MTLQLAGFKNIKTKTQHSSPNRILTKANNPFWNNINNLLTCHSIIFNLQRRKSHLGRTICSHLQIFSTLFNKFEFLWILLVCQDVSRFQVGLLWNQCKVSISHLGFHYHTTMRTLFPPSASERSHKPLPCILHTAPHPGGNCSATLPRIPRILVVDI